MRTDLKVGVICLFALVLGCVGFFAYHSNKPGNDVVSAGPAHPSSSGLSMAPPADSPTTAPSLVEAPASSSLTGFGPSHALGAESGGYSGMISPPGSATTAPATVAPPSSGSTGLAAPIGAPSSFHDPLVPGPTGGPSSPGMSGNTSLSSGNTGLLPPSTPATAPGLTTGGSTIGAYPSAGSTPTFGSSAPTGTLETPSHRPTLEIGSTPSSGSVDFPSVSSSSSSSTPGTYAIQKGDTFGGLAKKNHTTTKAILAANPGVNPNRLKIGQKINLPGASSSDTSSSSSSSSLSSLSGTSTVDTLGSTSTATTKPSKSHRTATTRSASTKGTKGKAPQASLAGGTYTIKKGDTLRKIAKSVYGDERVWRRIFRVNRGDMASANDLKVGQVIRLPK
jgi:LysM repeat protein